MKDSEAIAKINELLSHAEVSTGKAPLSDKKLCIVRRSHYNTETKEYVTFCIANEHAALYREIFWFVYKKGSIKDSYTIKVVKDKLQAFMFHLRTNNTPATTRTFSKFINKLNSAKKEKMTIFHQIYGLDVTDEQPITMGCFTLYSYRLHKDRILSLTSFQTEEELLNWHTEFEKHDIWISTEVVTADLEKAYEIACGRFEVLQGICQFVFDVEGYNAHAVSILNDVQSLYSRCYIISESQMMDKGERDIRRFRNANANTLVHDINHLFLPLIEKVFVPQSSEILNRVRNAFTTYGRILHERADTQKFAMYITTIESLIEFNEANLTELIAGYLSAMISDNIEDYAATKADFKITYNQRSEISHGSRTDILKGDLEYAKIYTVELIRKFVTDKEIFSFKKNKELRAHLDSKIKRLEVQGS